MARDDALAITQRSPDTQSFHGVAQDTRADAPGFALHAELERTAIEVGDALIAARAPRWSHAYAQWRARFA